MNVMIKIRENFCQAEKADKIISVHVRISYCLQSAYHLTRSALFLNLFITANCWSLARTVSPRETFGAFFAFCNQGWSARAISLINRKSWEVLENLVHSKKNKTILHDYIEVQNTLFTYLTAENQNFLICWWKSFSNRDIRPWKLF